MESINGQGSNPSTNEIKQLKEDIQSIKTQFEIFKKEVAEVKETSKKINSIADDVNKLNTEVGQLTTCMHEITEMSKSIQDISNRLNQMNMNNPMKMRDMGMMKNVLRKTAVKTVSSVICVAGAAMEKVSMVREEIEDIVAEAHYNTKKKKMESCNDQ